MAFISSTGEMFVKSELDIFTLPPLQTSIESGSLQSYRPITSLSNSGPIEFVVSGCSNDEYLDLARVYLHLQVKLSVPVPARTEAVPNPRAPLVGPVNNWLHSMFSQVDVYLNQKCITPPNNCYNYRALYENLLNYCGESKETHLTTGLYYADTPGKHDTIGAENLGFMSRVEYTKGNKKVDLFGPLHCDLFNVDRYLLGGVEMTVKLQQAKTAFHLMGPVESMPMFEILDAELFVRKVKIAPSVLLAHNKALSVATAKYPITRVDMKAITIPSGSQTKTIDNIYLGILPKRCIIGFVKTSAYNGCLNESPYKFEHFNLNFLAAYLDSIPIPSKPYVCDFPNGQYTRAYNSLFEGSNIDHQDTGNKISREAYPEGYTLFAIDLTPDLSASATHLSLAKTGSLRLEVRFDEALTSSITAIIYSEFAGLIEVDKNRNIFTDFSS